MKMMKEQKVGLFVVAENTYHYHGAPSGIEYTFMKGRGLWITDPKDIEFFKMKVAKGSGFRIEKDTTNMADNVKVIKKEDIDQSPIPSITPTKKKKKEKTEADE